MTRKHPAQELEEDVLVRTSNMGQGRSDYEAFHTLSPAIHLREIHTHDFFELYIHLNGFPRLYVCGQQNRHASARQPDDFPAIRHARHNLAGHHP